MGKRKTDGIEKHLRCGVKLRDGEYARVWEDCLAGFSVRTCGWKRKKAKK